MKIIYILTLLAFIPVHIHAQKPPDYNAVDARMRQIPQKMTKTVDDIASYVKKNFKTDEEKVRATFYWITHNISYDISRAYTIEYYEKDQEILDEVMTEKKGLCIHYAMLFSHICNKAGVKTYVVTGFTRQNGKMDTSPHAWSAAYVGSRWWLFDPTWGSGNIQNGKFVRLFKETHFNPQPEEYVKSHCPFDPSWQLLKSPISNKAFIKADFSISPRKIAYNFKDSITLYEKQDSIQQQLTLLRRLEKNGIENNLLKERQNEIKKEINRLRLNESVYWFNNAVVNLNKGIEELNRFINYRNNQFTPKRPDTEIKQILDNAGMYFDRFKDQFVKIKYTDAKMKESVNQIRGSFYDVSGSFEEQKRFLTEYINTSPTIRHTLFYTKK